MVKYAYNSKTFLQVLAKNNVDRIYRIDDFQSLNKIQKSLTESVYKLTLEGR